MQAENTQLLPDEHLLEKIRSGDRIAFESIYNKYSAALYFSAYNLFRDKQVCEDLVQDLFVHLWVKRNYLKIDSLKPYLFKAIRNRVLMVIRSGRARPDASVLRELAQQYSPYNSLAEKDINRILDESIRCLPEKCREIFRLSRKDHLSNKEIAAKLNISTKTVENQITIALRRLKTSFGDFLLWAGLLLSIF